MKKSLVGLAIAACVVSSVFADVSGSFKGVSFWATDGGRKFVVSGGTGVLKNEKGEVVAEGTLKTVEGCLTLAGKKGSTFAYKASAEAFANDAFPKEPPTAFAEVEYTEAGTWVTKDAKFLFVLEVPALNAPQVKVELDKSLARASIIALAKGNYTLWGNVIEVGEGGGSVKVQGGSVVESKNAKVGKKGN
ncbi:MAG: hypothetical protein WC789_09830 [Lentisphaeria bacterium]|jgi:hypothetical protein